MSTPAEPIEISCRDLQQLRSQEAAHLLLDCREPEEYATACIAGARLLPMGELRDRLEELTPYRTERIVVHCHHGGRSLRVAMWLRQQGFPRAQSLAGGIEQWAVEIDPSIPRY
jgi:rhodanese-related sulfurtransferase